MRYSDLPPGPWTQLTVARSERQRITVTIQSDVPIIGSLAFGPAGAEVIPDQYRNINLQNFVEEFELPAGTRLAIRPPTAQFSVNPADWANVTWSITTSTT